MCGCLIIERFLKWDKYFGGLIRFIKGVVGDCDFEIDLIIYGELIRYLFLFFFFVNNM